MAAIALAVGPTGLVFGPLGVLYGFATGAVLLGYGYRFAWPAPNA